MVYIAPSILSADFCHLQDQVQKAIKGGADYIHCDIMDGHFVPNITFGPFVVKALKKFSTVPLDVHLMICDPDFYAPKFIEAGADFVTVHNESVYHLHRSITYIKDLGVKAGVSINPATPLSALEEILEYVDLILIMSVNPGFGGQSFIPSCLDKIRRLREMLDKRKLPTLIEVDGGIDADNAAEVAAAGADILVAGSASFKGGDPETLVRKIKENAQRARSK